MKVHSSWEVFRPPLGDLGLVQSRSPCKVLSFFDWVDQTFESLRIHEVCRSHCHDMTVRKWHHCATLQSNFITDESNHCHCERKGKKVAPGCQGGWARAQLHSKRSWRYNLLVENYDVVKNNSTLDLSLLRTRTAKHNIDRWNKHRTKEQDFLKHC